MAAILRRRERHRRQESRVGDVGRDGVTGLQAKETKGSQHQPPEGRGERQGRDSPSDLKNQP